MLSQMAKNLVPYTAGEQPRDRKYIKLNTNENPYPPSPSVQAVLRGADYAALRLYPDLDCTELRDEIAKKERVKRENVFVGNGSDEVLAFAFAALFDKEKPVRFADVTYSFYPVYCALFGLSYQTVPLTQNFLLNRKGLCGGGGIVIANPNAPTGLYENVSEFVGMNVPVIIDEAYIDFSRGQSLATAAANSQNAVVVKTFSKSYALAGMRCGYAVAGAEIIDGLSRVKNAFNSYSVNTVTQAAATAALRDKEYFNGRIADVVRTRDAFCDTLNRLGYACAPSQTNFLLATVPDGNGEKAYRFLKENGVLVRWFNAPRLCDKLRITVGADEEMDALASLLKQREK